MKDAVCRGKNTEGLLMVDLVIDRSQRSMCLPREAVLNCMLPFTGVAHHSLDEGLPTLTSSTIWSTGSPQNQGWSGGDFEAVCAISINFVLKRATFAGLLFRLSSARHHSVIHRVLPITRGQARSKARSMHGGKGT